MIYEEKKKKISIVTPSLNGGGAEKIAVNLANHFAELGYSVDLVVFKLIGPYQSLVSGSVQIINLDVSRTRYVLFKTRSYLKKNQNAMVLSVIRDANIFVGLASFGLKMKSLIYREANTLDAISTQSRLKRFLYKALMKTSYYRANAVIANSDDTKFDLIKNKIVNSKKVKVIRNPVLTSSFELLKFEAVNEEWFTQNGIKIVLSVGRLHPQKNFSFLISAFKDVYKNCEDARLIIVGEGSEKDKLLDQIKDEGLSKVVKLVKFQNNVYPYYQNSDVFALSSEWEGFGNVLVEALSVGLPVVSTNCPGGPKMILENIQYGQLVPLGDKEAYVNALLKSLESPKKSQKSIDYAMRFTVESVAKDYLALDCRNKL